MPAGDENLLESLADAPLQWRRYRFLLVGLIGDSHAAGQVDKRDMGAGLLMQLDSRLEEDFCQRGIIFVGNGVAARESMEAENVWLPFP